LIGTPGIVRDVLPGLRRYPEGVQDALDRVETLLADHDAAAACHG
jgi:hypothetical protein